MVKSREIILEELQKCPPIVDRTFGVLMLESRCREGFLTVGCRIEWRGGVPWVSYLCSFISLVKLNC